MGRIRTALLLLALLPAARASAGWSDLVPIPFGNRAEIEGYAFAEEDRMASDHRSTYWRDEFFRERIRVESHGFWYSPRFLLYDVSLGAGLRQERFETEPGGEESRTGSSTEYDLRLTLLPEHAYNLIVHASRFEPLTREKSSRPFRSVETTRGVTARYRDKPWFLSGSWVEDTIETSETRSTTRRGDAQGEWFRRFVSGNELSFTGSAKSSRFETDRGLGGDGSELHAGNLLRIGGFRATTDVSRSELSQSGGSGRLRSSQLLLQHRASAAMPAGFRSEGSLRWRRGESDLSGGRSSRSFTDTSSEVTLRLAHRLYRSLDTAATLLRTDRRSTGGSSSSTSRNFLANYVKLVPRGTLTAGATLNRLTTEADGRGTDVVDEAHPGVAVPTDWIRLTQRDADPASVVVSVVSPVPPRERILVDEGVHYTLRTEAGLGFTEILVHALPADLPIPAVYDFLLSYAVAGSDHSLRTDSVGANASLSLFGDRVVPYASWLDVTSEVLSGRPPGVPLDATSITVGFRLQQGPLRFVAERQEQRSELSPYESWKGEATWSATAGESTSIYLSALHQERNRRPTAVDTLRYRERTDSVTGNLQQRFPFVRGLSIAIGGSWSRTRGLVDATAWSASASFGWRIGKLDVAAGASAYSAESDADAGERPLLREHRSVFVRVRREIW